MLGNVRPIGRPESARTVGLAALAMLAFAANSLLCRMALQPGLIDPATFFSVRLASGAAALILIARIGPARPAAPADWLAASMLFAYVALFSFAYARLAPLYALTSEMVKTQGRPGTATVQDFLNAGFQERDVLYIVLAIAVKTLSNYSNHAFATPVDDVFSAYKVD